MLLRLMWIENPPQKDWNEYPTPAEAGAEAPTIRAAEATRAAKTLTGRAVRRAIMVLSSVTDRDEGHNLLVR